jgi:hypothetical protein
MKTITITSALVGLLMISTSAAAADAIATNLKINAIGYYSPRCSNPVNDCNYPRYVTVFFTSPVSSACKGVTFEDTFTAMTSIFVSAFLAGKNVSISYNVVPASGFNGRNDMCSVNQVSFY